MTVTARNTIRVTEKNTGKVHQLNFDTEAEARKAYQNMVWFWKQNDKAAVMIESQYQTLCVSSDMVASVLLNIDPAAPPSPVKAPAPIKLRTTTRMMPKAKK